MGGISYSVSLSRTSERPSASECSGLGGRGAEEGDDKLATTIIFGGLGVEFVGGESSCTGVVNALDEPRTGRVVDGCSCALLRHAMFSLAESRTLARRVLDFLQLLRWLLKAFVCEKLRPQQHSYILVS